MARKDDRPNHAPGVGEAHAPEVVTETREEVATAAHLAPDTILEVDHAAEAKYRLDGARSKVQKLTGHLKAAQAEVARLEKGV